MPAYFANRRGLRSGAAGGGEVAPDDTFLTIFGSDLVAWYDASDAASITEVAGAVSQWNDKSGNDDHLTQGTGAANPTYSATGLGGSQPSLSFDGGDYLISTTDAVAPGAVSDFACFVVGRLNAGANANGRFVSYVGTGETTDHSNAASAILLMRDGSNQAVGAYRNGALGVKAVTYDTTFNAASVWSGGNHTAYVENVAGTPVADASGALAAAGTIIVGHGFNAGLPQPASSVTGHISEIAFVKIAPSAGQLTSVQAMLAAKWTA
jgi:hypothetical protein